MNLISAGQFSRFRTTSCTAICAWLIIVLWLGPTGAQTFARNSAVVSEVKIGVLANNGSAQCLADWNATADYLTEHIPGYRFEIVPLGYADVEPAVADKQVDFVLVNPAMYVTLEAKYQISRNATLKKKQGKYVSASYGTVIICRSDTQSIQSLYDLKGKSFMAPEENSFGGWLMALRELHSKGIDPNHDFKSLQFSGTQEKVVMAVLQGDVDAGAIRTDVLEHMSDEGKIQLGDFKVISAYQGAREAEFPYLISTRIYPEWPLAKLRHTPLRLAEEVTEQLLNILPDSPAAKNANLAGWTYPGNYRVVQECLRELGIAPFHVSPAVTLGQVLRTYWPWLLAATLAITVMVGVIVIFARLNRRLAFAQDKVRKELAERQRTEIELRQAKEKAEKTNDQLRKTSAFQQAILNSTEYSIIATEPDGTITAFNAGAEHMLGYSAEEMVGKTTPEIIHDKAEVIQHAKILSRELGRSIPPGFEVFVARARLGRPDEGEWTYIRKDGSRFPVLLSVTTIYNDARQITGFLGIAQDITARKLAEEALRLAKKQAEEANRAKSQFVAATSHELRTPLNGVIGMTELLRNTQLDPRQREYVEACYSSGRSLLDLINDILDFSKIEAGKLELEEHEFDLANLVDEIVETLSFPARQKKLQFTTSIAPEACCCVEGDSTRLRQVLINLISNAIKFTDLGQVTVQVAAAGDKSGKTLFRFEISDTGIGIPPDRIEGLFTSFYQANSFTTRKYGGTGLGLTICKQILELMGGRISVESKLNQGSTFSFEVPLRLVQKKPLPMQDSPQATDLRQQMRNTMLRGRRVLLAEDNYVNRMYTQEILRQAGVECRSVENGLQTIQALEEGHFDLILMDCQMPEMDGFQATRYIREMEVSGIRSGHLPVVALTASAIKGDRERCLASGMDAYISKPFEPDRLLDVIMRLFIGKGAKPTEEPAGQSQPAPAPIEDQLPLDYETLLARCLGDLQFAQSMLSDFEKELPKYVDEIARQFSAGEVERITASAHSLKGAAGVIAARPLQKQAEKIEFAGKGGDLADVASLIDQLREEMHRCIHAIPQIMEKMAPT